MSPLVGVMLPKLKALHENQQNTLQSQIRNALQVKCHLKETLQLKMAFSSNSNTTSLLVSKIIRTDASAELWIRRLNGLSAFSAASNAPSLKIYSA